MLWARQQRRHSCQASSCCVPISASLCRQTVPRMHRISTTKCFGYFQAQHLSSCTMCWPVGISHHHHQSQTSFLPDLDHRPIPADPHPSSVPRDLPTRGVGEMDPPSMHEWAASMPELPREHTQPSHGNGYCNTRNSHHLAAHVNAKPSRRRSRQRPDRHQAEATRSAG